MVSAMRRSILLLLCLTAPLAARAAEDPDAAFCEGRRALIGAAAWSAFAAGAGPDAAAVDALVERGLLPKRPVCGEAGTFSVALERDRATVRCPRHGETVTPRPAPGADPLAPFRKGCYEAQRSLEVLIGLYCIERPPEEGEEVPLAAVLAKAAPGEAPRCPAGGVFSLGREGGALYPDCSYHGPLSAAGEPPAAKPGVAMPAPKLLETPEGRAKVCADNLRTIEAAVERVCGDVHVSLDTEFKLDLLVESGYLKLRPLCPDGGEYTIANDGVTITIACPKHGKRQLAY